MKNKLTILMFTALCFNVNAQDKILVGGASSDKIAIIDKETKQIEWKYSDPDGKSKECNSLLYTDDGNVMYVHKKSAILVTPEGKNIWELKVDANEEMQSVSVIKGGYLIGIAGTPSRFLEVNKKGDITKEITFETGVANHHGQFRQIAKTKRGTYIIPISSSKRIVELDAKGKLIKDIELEYGSLFLSVDSKGNWLAACGHDGVIYKIDGKTGKRSELVAGKELGGGITTGFAAGIVELKNGNYLLANWVGHKGDQTQPILIEFDKSGNIIWRMNKLEGLTYISGIYPIY